MKRKLKTSRRTLNRRVSEYMTKLSQSNTSSIHGEPSTSQTEVSSPQQVCELNDIESQQAELTTIIQESYDSYNSSTDESEPDCNSFRILIRDWALKHNTHCIVGFIKNISYFGYS